MKNLLLLAAALPVIFVLSFCKNTPAPEQQSATTETIPVDTAGESSASAPTGQIDTVAGFRGCEKASWVPSANTNIERFYYQHFTVKVMRNGDKPGEQIIVYRKDSLPNVIIPMPENRFFMGLCRNKLFVTTAPDAPQREMFIYDIDKMQLYFESPYCGEPEIVHFEKLYFLLPTDKKEVTKIPDCPEKEEWEKNGKEVGYGQRAVLNLLRYSFTRKSEWACVPK